MAIRHNLLPALLTTTALVGFAAAAQAQTLSGASSAPVLTSATGLTPTFDSTARYGVSTGPAVEISGTGAAVITIQTGGVVSSTAVTGTIVTRADTNLTAVTINNSGTIVNTTASAISATATQADGSTEINTIINNTGTISGNIATGGGADQLNSTNGTITGNTDLGAGANVIVINGGTVTGSITTGAGADTLTLASASTVTGDVTLGGGGNTATITGNARLNGNFVAGGGNNNVLNLTNGIVSGTINMGGGTGDTLNVSGTTYTTLGTITGAERLNVSATTLNVRHGITGVDTFRVNSGSTLNVSQTFALASGGSLINSGTIRVGAGNSITADTINFAGGGRLIVDVASATSAGQLVTAGGMSTASYTINLTGSTYIASGTALTIVDGGATSTLDANSLTNSAQEGVHTFTLSRANTDQDIVLTIGRVSTSSLVSSEAGKSAANVLDVLGTNVSGTLQTIQSNITNATTAAQVNSIAESLTPGIDGIGAAGLSVAQATGGQISNRLASLRSGVATGEGLASRHMWMEGFGASANQDDRKGNKGYDSSAAGVTVGFDSDEYAEGLNLGAAFSYSKGKVESDASNNAETDIDTYGATLYGSTVYDNGIFLQGQLGLGYSQYDMERTVSGVGKAKGDTNGWQSSVKAEVGRDYAFDALTITPMVGAQYTYLDVDGYTETGAGGASLEVKPESMGALDLSAGGRLAYSIAMADGSTLRPNLRAAVITRAGDTSMDSTARFTGGGASFKTPGIEGSRTGANLGAGLLFAGGNGMDLSADYDADLRSSYTGHAFKLKARFAF